MSAETYKRLKRKVRDLCVLLHSERIGEEVLDRHASLSDLFQLSTEDMLDYMKHLVESLVQAKKVPNEAEFKSFQKALQKLEAEVRNHIQVRSKQIEEQLKIYVEHVEAKLEKSERLYDKQLKEAEVRVQSLEKENNELQKVVAKGNRHSSLPGFDLEVEQLKQRFEMSQGYIKELESKLLQQETKFAKLLSRPESVNLDAKHERELDAIKKKYDDKCSEMSGLVKRLNSLIAFKKKVLNSASLKDSRTAESRDVSPLPVSSVLKKKLKAYKSNYGNDIHMSPSKTRPIERSKSTERLQSRTSRASSRSRGNLSSTVRKGI